LADPRVANHFNDTFVCTFLKVGTFRIVNGQKVGGNVASYFCLSDGSVVHAIPGPVDANKLLSEARWAYEARKSALTFGTNLARGKIDMRKYQQQIKRAHEERFQVDRTPLARNVQALFNEQPLPAAMPLLSSKQAQVHWLLATQPLAKIDTIYPIVWTQILKEQLSTLPVENR
jgi:hypothetical protein